MPQVRCLCICIVLNCCFIFSLAYADNASMLGLSSRASAMAGALTALSDDYTATFFNPAALSCALDEDQWLETGFSLLYTTRNFEVKDSSGEILKEDFETKGLAFGFTVDLDRLVGLDDWSLGLDFYLPKKGLLELDIPTTAQEYFFPIYNDVGKALNASIGIAWCVFDNLSIGIGANLLLCLPDTDSHIVAFVDANELVENPDLIDLLLDQGTIELGDSVDFDVGVNREMVLEVGFHGGITLDILESLRLGFSYREKIGPHSYGYQYLYIEPVDEQGNVVEDLAERLPVLQVPVSYFAFFNPTEYSLGIGIITDRILLDLDITYALWSGYRGPHKERPPEQFDDTFNPKIGLEYYLNEKITLRGGYAWRPSPAPEQNGKYNYLDADTHIFCGGIAYHLPRGSIEAHLQYHVMEDQEVDKEGGLPDIEYEGSLMHAGISYMVEF